MEHQDEVGIPTALTHDEDSDDINTDSEEESMNEEEETTCLFCKEVLRNVDEAIKHVENDHNIKFSKLKSKFQMDQYSFIKLINCIRHEHITADALYQAQEPFWLEEKYLKAKDYEPWLTYDYEYIETPNINGADKDMNGDLRALVATLKQQITNQNDQLEQAAHNMAVMRKTFQRIIDKDDSQTTLKCSAGNLPLKHDEGYFENYDHFGIHHEMLTDTVRTSSYRDAFLKNREFVQGKDVLDVGCGTGILSIFAALAGANKVIGIDNSNIVHRAMSIVQKNNIANVSLVKGRLEDTVLSQEKFDIIVSEWMGYFLLFEGMLDTIIYARDHHLKAGGILLPNRCTMSIIGYGDDDLFKQHITFWNNVYGLNMSTMREEVLHEPLIDITSPEHVLTEANCISDLDLHKVDLNYSNFKHNFELSCIKDGTLSSFVGYFDVYFDLPQAIMFSTSPKCKPTHWKQVVFFLEDVRLVKKGDVIRGSIQCNRSTKCTRSLNILLNVFDKHYTYYLD